MKAAIVGATGYAGQELCGLLATHPVLEPTFPMRGRADSPAADGVGALDTARFAEVDVVFLCTPHGAAAPLARAALDSGARVVDLSADFRLKDPAAYEAAYGGPHPAPDLLDAAVYGLSEHARGQVAGAQLIANPGCYPTAVLLGLLPALEGQLVEHGTPIIADCKSGVSGAGVAPSLTTHYGNVAENFAAYKVGEHRHAPEIHQGAGTEQVVFVPHLLPCFRGILATLYLTPIAGVNAGHVREVLEARYRDEPFVTVRSDRMPNLHDVDLTNQCHLGVADAYGQIVVVSVIDNLVKGAAGQALQNANLALGLEEGLGLA